MNTLITTKHFIFALLAGLLLFTACSKEDDPFTGKDNYITSFSLKQGETVLNAVIADNVITIKAPEGLSLDGATATVKLSENAKIYPDPSIITDWSDETIFAVTAYNGTQIRYKYTVVRNSIDAEGTIVLETQADVNAFGEKGITAIGGNLVIGRTVGADSITTLAPLAQLKEIAYSLIIYPTYSATDLTGLDKLEKVGGDIRMDGVKNLETVAFPNLKTTGEIYIKNTLIGVAEFPALVTVAKALTLDCPLAEMRFPNLKTVGGKITLNTASNSGAMLPRVSFPALEDAGGIYSTYFKSASKVELPELKKVGDMNFNQMTMLSVIIAPKLETSTGTITIPSTAYLSEVSFPSLTQVASLVVDSRTIRVLDFPNLKTVTGRLAIQNNAQVNGVMDFKALEHVEGELYLYELSQMKQLALPASLQRIGKLSIYNRTTDPLTEIDVRGLNIGELKVMANNIKAKLIGDDVFHGTLTVSSSNASYNNGYPDFPKLQGFREVDSLSLDGYVSYMDTVHIRSIQKINKGFRLENNNIKRFSMPDLEEIGGDFYFARLDQGVDETLEFAKLKKIGGSFEFAVGSTKTRTLRFTALESVGGNFTLSTGYNADRSLDNILFPALKTIGGKMVLQPYGGASNTNRLLKNLDGFATLKSVQSIEVSNQMAIESFEGLKEAFKSITAAGWKATGNNYNPTYEDLQNGKWVKP